MNKLSYFKKSLILFSALAMLGMMDVQARGHEGGGQRHENEHHENMNHENWNRRNANMNGVLEGEALDANSGSNVIYTPQPTYVNPYQTQNTTGGTWIYEPNR